MALVHDDKIEELRAELLVGVGVVVVGESLVKRDVDGNVADAVFEAVHGWVLPDWHQAAETAAFVGIRVGVAGHSPDWGKS